jgi:hypothetical protein
MLTAKRTLIPGLKDSFDNQGNLLIFESWSDFGERQSFLPSFGEGGRLQKPEIERIARNYDSLSRPRNNSRIGVPVNG